MVRDLATFLLALAVVRVGAIFDVWTGVLATCAALCSFYSMTARAWTLEARTEVEPREVNQGSEPK